MAHYTAFLFGTPSLQAPSCSIQAIRQLPRASVVLCILHLKMAMGRSPRKFVDREAMDLSPSAMWLYPGWSVCGVASPDGEKIAVFCEVLLDIAGWLGIGHGSAK